MTRTVSLCRSRSSSAITSPWKFGSTNPRTSSCTGPIAILSPLVAGASRLAVDQWATHRPNGMNQALLGRGGDPGERTLPSSHRALKRRSPAREQRMDGGRADDRLCGSGQSERMEDERPRLRSAESAVERDQLLERAAFVKCGVVEAVHEQVGSVRESVGAKKVTRGVGREARERILALDRVIDE